MHITTHIHNTKARFRKQQVPLFSLGVTKHETIIIMGSRIFYTNTLL